MANKVALRSKKGKFKTGTKPKVAQKSRFTKAKVQDARQKILQKKRKTVVDARDILAKMAQTQDARSKINKIREGRSGAPTKNGNIKAIGHNILRKTDRNGKISLSTNKGTRPTSEMSAAIQKQLGLISPPRSSLVKRLTSARRSPVHVSLPAPSIRKTIANSHNFENSFNPTMYKWTNPAASQVIGSLGRREELMDNAWQTFSVNRQLRMPRAYIDLDSIEDGDEDMPIVPLRTKISLQGTSRVSNIHSRLDTAAQPESHGILSQTKTKVVVPAGHRIVVSNLQNTVSQEDIKELFEDIGDLLAARLVRPGVAEVIYKNLKDAQKAVDTYHNRQLDGQPMKCLLVNKRPLNYPTAPAVLKSDSHNLPNRKLAGTAYSNKLVPDISTIHKVLFQRK